jgi:PKD repeat protein
MKRDKIILTIIILSVIALVFSGCEEGNLVTPPIPNNSDDLNDTEIPEPTEAIFQFGKLVLGGISCHLVWKYNSDNEVGFLIQRMTTVYNPWSEVPDHTPFVTIARVGPNVTEYTDIAPLAAYVLVYRVAAIAADGRLSEWTTFSVVVMGRPTELQAEISGSPLHVKLNWEDNSRNELGFRIYRWTGIGDEGPWLEQSDTEWPLLDTVGANGETFTDVEVKSGYTHRYFVVAFNDDESSLPSNVETVFIPSQQPTADFTFKLSGLTVNFTDTSTDPDNNIVSWYWDFSDDKTSDTQNPIHTYLKAGTYDVILTVTDTAGFTSTKTQTITVCTAPGSFTLSATPECNGTTSQIRLNWTNSSGVSSYDVYRNSTLYYSGLTGTQYINSGNITVGTAYSYYIIAKNSCGSTASNIVSATAISCGSTTIGIVQLLSPSNGATLPPGNITFTWNPVNNATKYQFILYNSQGQVALDTIKSSTSLIVALGTEGTITWKVRAGDNSGNWGAWSSTWSLTLKSTTTIGQVQLSSPSNGATISTSTVVLSWDSVSGATGYEVVYDTSSSFTNPIGWSVSGTSQTTGTLTNGTTYYWRVRAFAGSQYYSWSSIWSFTKSSAIVSPIGLSVSSYWNTTSPGFPSMVLSWNAASGATGYEMWVRPSGGSYTFLGTRDAPYVTFNSNSLPGGARYVSGTTYYFKVRTVTSSSTSDFTSEVPCVAAAPPPSSQVERITNGSFSSGTSGWTLVGDFWAGTNFSNYRTPPGYAAGGVNNEGLPINNAAGWMYQTVTIPSGATSAILSFWYNITSYNPGPNKVDFLTVYVSDSGGNWLDWIIYSNLDCTYLGDYKKKTFDLTAHKGKTVTIKFLATSDYSNTTTFRIDDVSLMSDG